MRSPVNTMSQGRCPLQGSRQPSIASNEERNMAWVTPFEQSHDKTTGMKRRYKELVSSFNLGKTTFWTTDSSSWKSTCVELMYTRTYFQCPKGRVTVVEDSLDCGASRRAAAASAMARCRSALRAQYVAMRSHHSSSMDVSSTPTNVSRSLATSILMMILAATTVKGLPLRFRLFRQLCPPTMASMATMCSSSTLLYERSTCSSVVWILTNSSMA
mmetsp:Transcript_45892/g.77163  ORF Transcript_45892/g.77163 Transcript_45892/m.77163 type:complete len:215 (-) Transcript_45892:257-901(-)